MIIDKKKSLMLIIRHPFLTLYVAFSVLRTVRIRKPLSVTGSSAGKF